MNNQSPFPIHSSFTKPFGILTASAGMLQLFLGLSLSWLLLHTPLLNFLVAESTIALAQSNSDSETEQQFQTGVEQFRQGLFNEALESFKIVLEQQEKQGSQEKVAETLVYIGEIQTNLGNDAEALVDLQKALTLYRDLDQKSDNNNVEFKSGISRTLNLIGFVYRNQNKTEEALKLHQEALQLAQSINDLSNIGESLHNLAYDYTSLKQYDEALKLYQDARKIREQVGDKRDLSRTLNNLGALYIVKGDTTKALEIYQQALALRRQIGDQAGVGRLLSNMGLLYHQLGDDSQALIYLQQASEMLNRIEDHTSAARVQNLIGEIYEKIQQPEQALTAYQKALTILQQTGNQQEIQATQRRIESAQESLAEANQN